MVRLNQMMRRVRLEPLPDGFAALLPAARELVTQRKEACCWKESGERTVVSFTRSVVSRRADSWWDAACCHHCDPQLTTDN